MEIKGKKILFLGDSITEGFRASKKENAYWKVLEKETGAIVKAYGIGGTRIAEQINKIDSKTDNSHFITRVNSMDEDADIIAVFGGTNDYGHGDAPLGQMSDRTDKTFYGAMHNLCCALIERYPYSKIIIMTPTHRANENSLLNERGIRNVATMSRYVEIEKEVAEFYSLPVLDLYAISGLNPEIKKIQDLYMNDGLHPNDLGHKRIAEVIKSFLEIL